MVEQILIQFKADKTLKQEATEIYERPGMDLQTITRVEAKNAFYELRRQAADVPEMSFDEINAEILAARAERKR